MTPEWIFLNQTMIDKRFKLLKKTDNEFRDNLLEVENYIRNNYRHLDQLWGDKNKAKVAIERLIRYHIYTNLVGKIKNVYPSPLSPDMAIELSDVILCVDAKTIDMCGTGGDGKNTFNVSTTASFVVAASGIKVAKHGNYGVSSGVGSSLLYSSRLGC